MAEPLDELEKNEHQAKLNREAELRQASLVQAMTQTDGWKIVENDLMRTREEQIKTLLELPITPENLPLLAVAQAQAKACNLPLDIVNEYISARNRILDEDGLMI